jgi:hypothetical protein
VEEIRGAEENYFSMMQKMTIPFPWIADLNAVTPSNTLRLRLNLLIS